jgi:histidyl-tRNA synthetase
VQKPSIPKGTRDFGPAQTRKRRYIIQQIEQAFKRYGFNPIETPTMENLSVLTGKYGDEGDQLLFKILNSGDFLKKTTEQDYLAGSAAMLPKIAEKGLRYDLTVPFARYVVMNQHEINFPFKRYQIQPVWRADRPQKGRYREFYQCDADIVGTRSLWNEVELTLLIHDVFESLGLQDFDLKLNHREVLFSMAAAAGMKGQEIPFCVALDKLDKIGIEKVLEEIGSQDGDTQTVSELLAIIDSDASDQEKLIKLKEITGDNAGYQQLLDFLQHISSLEADGRHFQLSLDFSLARGLSYYTGMIYEVKPTSVKMGSICGGGRYDNLTGVFGLKDVSGIGISFGLDRIYDVMEELGLFPESTYQGVKVLLTHFDEKSFAHAMLLLDKLRRADIAAELYPDSVKLKKQITYANKEGIPFVITIGDNEITSQKYPLKDMASGEQAEMNLNQLIERLK